MTVPVSDLQTSGDSADRMGATVALAIFWILSTAIVVAAAGFMMWDMREREMARAEQELGNLAHILAEQTARAMQGVGLILRGTEDRLRQGRNTGSLMDPWSIHNLLYARVTGMPQVRLLLQIDADGILRHSSGHYPAQPLALGDREYFIAQRDSQIDGIQISKPVQDRFDGKWLLPMTSKMIAADGRFLGVVMAGISPPYFEELYRSLALGEGSEVSLILRDGTLAARHPYREEEMGKPVAGFPAGAAPGSLPAVTRGTGDKIVAYGEVKGYPLVVEVAVPESAVLAGWRQLAGGLAFGAALTLLVLTTAMVALGRKMMREEALASALGDSRARLQGIIASAMDAIITVDEDQRIVLFNPAAERMFGCPVDEALGAPLERFIPERFRGRHREHLAKFGATGVSSRTMGSDISIFACRANGEEFPADISISQAAAEGQKLYTAIVRDITARRRAEEDLRKSHRQLRELTGFLETVREDERTRIARELHDELGQHLTGLKMDLSWMESRLPEGNEVLAGKVVGMKKLIDATVASTRRISSELRPLVLDDLGLSAGLEWLARDFRARSGIEVALDLGDEEWELESGLSTAIFRIAQESLTNVARHAAASRVDVTLARKDRKLRLEVVDDGRGMAPGDAEKSGHFGLLGMGERIRACGGELRITSAPGEGTALVVTIPLPSEEAGS